jgi:hypothetical protein
MLAGWHPQAPAVSRSAPAVTACPACGARHATQAAAPQALLRTSHTLRSAKRRRSSLQARGAVCAPPQQQQPLRGLGLLGEGCSADDGAVWPERARPQDALGALTTSSGAGDPFDDADEAQVRFYI